MNQSPNFGGGELIALLIPVIFALVIAVVVLYVWARIFSNAGYSGWTCLLMIIPLVNLIWLLVFAFSKWPIVRELETYRQRYGSLSHGFEVQTAPPPGAGYAPAPAPRG